MGKGWSSPQCSLCRRNGTGRESLALLLRWSGQERRSRNRTRAIKLPPLGAGGVERATQLLRQGEAKDFKKFSQMKLQMKRQTWVKMNRQASADLCDLFWFVYRTMGPRAGNRRSAV